jgi:hypothetical protein
MPPLVRGNSQRLPDVRRAGVRDHVHMLATGSPQIDAERAFSRALRQRRRATLLGRLRRACTQLPVYDERRLARRAPTGRGIREIPLCAISGTMEPMRAKLFDGAFRPSSAARARWQRLWLAEDRGTVLPPISVVPVDDGYAVRDGHHRVSVARARGALTIDATVESALTA